MVNLNLYLLILILTGVYVQVFHKNRDIFKGGGEWIN